ncbi:DUF4192 domain-containing protein [Streptomyces sp. NPDC047108]|uniref:DUF4192 domain-containing protein n=1 Tax=Streptomyces sp. NPDC047108 TaxID=3155025 RepID=UPI0033C02748
MTRHNDPSKPTALDQITLRSPAELADALPYLMGFHPDDSIVLVALHGDHGRFGGRLRLGIPAGPREWPYVAEQLADCLVSGSEKRASRPDGIIVFLCQDPSAGKKGRDVMERLRPLAQRLRTACGALDVPVLEALCISDGRFWSYCCPDVRCCPTDGTPLALPGTSAMAAAAAYAGIQVRGSLRDMEARLSPLTASTSAVAAQEEALDAATAELVPRILGGVDRNTVRMETLVLVRGLVERFVRTPVSGGATEADAVDDGLVGDEEAAAIILGLQDRMTRDRAAEWMEGPDAQAALRVWRAIARRCVGAFGDHAAAPLTLAGWVAMSTGDEPTARVALGMALRVDPDYLFAKLLHQGANEGLDPEVLRECLRRERDTRVARRPARMAAQPPAGRPRGRTRPGGHAGRRRERARGRTGQRRT